MRKNIPMNEIQNCVSKAARIPVDTMILPNHYPGSRKKEVVGARQVSMTLCKSYTRHSLATVGNIHGGRDHATVLHASKTVNNLLDANDLEMTKLFREAVKLIKEWSDKHDEDHKRPTIKELRKERQLLERDIQIVDEQLSALLRPSMAGKAYLVKSWINNNVPLEARWKILQSYA
jgi:Bacterial dnaA protein helix-turn-helix